MKPAFDPKKNASNISKHGMSLASADGVLNDPLAVTIEDPFILDQQRWIAVGANCLGSLLVVVWTERGNDFRIISARPATTKERNYYEEGV